MIEDLKWWTHRFVKKGVLTYVVDHQPSHKSESGYEASQPASGAGFDDICLAQAVIAAWEPKLNDSDWYIHREGVAFADNRSYLINHSAKSVGTKVCGPYKNLAKFQEDDLLCELDTTGNCK